MLLRGFESVVAENALLRVEVANLKETIKLQRKRAIWNKNLFEQLVDEDGNKAIFFSPTKIQQARDLQAKKEEEEYQKELEKEQRVIDRQLNKEAKEREQQLRRDQREEARIQREEAKQAKQAEIEAKQQQREVNKQLKNEVKRPQRQAGGKKKQINQSEGSKAIVQAMAATEAPEVLKTTKTRSGRTTQVPKRFEE